MTSKAAGSQHDKAVGKLFLSACLWRSKEGFTSGKLDPGCLQEIRSKNSHISKVIDRAKDRAAKLSSRSRRDTPKFSTHQGCANLGSFEGLLSAYHALITCEEKRSKGLQQYRFAFVDVWAQIKAEEHTNSSEREPSDQIRQQCCQKPWHLWSARRDRSTENDKLAEAALCKQVSTIYITEWLMTVRV